MGRSISGGGEGMAFALTSFPSEIFMLERTPGMYWMNDFVCFSLGMFYLLL